VWAARIPAFLAPPPATPVADFDLELRTLRATPPQRVRDDLRNFESTPRLDALRQDPETQLALLAASITEFFAAVLAPYWPRIVTIYEADVLHRARRLLDGGLTRLFDDLDAKLTWQTDSLRIAHRRSSGRKSLDGQGLLLMPSVFVAPLVFSLIHPPYQPTLRYPPRGAAALWESRAAEAPAALAAVVGKGRARLLAELDAPASTTDLARRTGLSAGGVSQHLTALRDAGLVDAHRTGRYVLYVRSRVGEALMDGAGEGRPGA
jgi:DNA-binding transcriptional ArsR family regulator